MQRKSQLLGSTVYNQVSMTGRNRSVLDDIAVLTAGGELWGNGKPPENLPPLGETALALVRDGSFVAVGVGKPDWYWMENVTVPLPGLVYEFLADSDGPISLSLLGGDASRPYTRSMRLFIRGATQWKAWLADGKALALLTQREQRSLASAAGPDKALATKIGLAPAEGMPELSAVQMYAHPGGLGLLYHAQHIYNRIEQVAQDTEDSLSKINRLPLIGGDIGDIDTARGAVDAAQNAVFFPGDFKVERMVSDAVIRALIADAEARSEDYHDALNVLPKEGANRPVARDRELRMQVMLQNVDNLHTVLSRIYADWGAHLSFRRLVVEDPAALLQRKQLLDSSQGVLGAEEYNKQVKALFGINVEAA